MLSENKIINGLWIGDRLSPLELLTIYSFIDQGCELHLWTYNALNNDLPRGVIIKDANLIVPQEKVFQKESNDPVSGIGAGSFGAPFSDLFRYKLLLEYGGWWVDMDVTCLKSPDFEQPYFFRTHPLLPAIGNIMKCPKGSELMELTYNEVQNTCNENTTDWLLPNKILNRHIMDQKLESYIMANKANNDAWVEIETLLYSNSDLPEDWCFIHWMNEEWRSRGLNKNQFYKGSTISALLQKYEIPFDEVNEVPGRKRWQIREKVRHSTGYELVKKMLGRS